jgi:hypothetical protein
MATGVFLWFLPPKTPRCFCFLLTPQFQEPLLMARSHDIPVTEARWQGVPSAPAVGVLGWNQRISAAIIRSISLP